MKVSFDLFCSFLVKYDLNIDHVLDCKQSLSRLKNLENGRGGKVVTAKFLLFFE